MIENHAFHVTTALSRGGGSFASFGCWLLTRLFLATHALGGVITWTAPRDITGDSDVSTNGTRVKAVSNAGSSYPTGNGVTFTPAYSGDSVSGVNASNASTIGAMPVGGGISAAYSTLLSKNDYNSGGGSTVTLTVNGLTAGHHYEVQIWANAQILTSPTPAQMPP